MTDFDASSHSRRSRRRQLILAGAAAPLLAGAPALQANTYPTRTIRLVCPFPAGGAADTVSRLVAGALGQELGQSVIVENRGGAGGNLAGEMVARGDADGYNLLVAGQAILAINKPLYSRLNYDPERDFRYVGIIASMPNVLIAHPQALPVKDIKEFVAYCKARPGDVTYGSNGIGSLSHLTTELMASQGGFKLLHVPYKGAAPLMVDLLAGRIACCLTGSAAAVPLVVEGKVKALAVTTAQRISALADVPTLKESGFPELEAPTWFAVVAPSGVPAPILERLQAAMAKATGTPEYKAALDRVASIIEPLNPSAGEAMLARERAMWATAVRQSGATTD